MGGVLPLHTPCAKGWLPYALEECSRMPRGRAILDELLDAMVQSLAPDYQNLTEIFDHYLLSHVVPDTHRAKVVRHLERHWFGSDRREAFFPDQDVAAIYGQGVINTLELSLCGSGKSPAPITSWWIVDSPTVKMLTFGEVDGRGSAEGAITLLIMTPRPQGAADTRPFILREEAEVWVSEQVQGQILSRCLGKPHPVSRRAESAELVA